MNGKINAAKLALNLVKDGTVLGIGSGTTVEVFLNMLGEKIKNEGMKIYGIPSSYQSHFAALRNGIKIVDLAEYPQADICIDSADQVDANMNCIKGGGAALTREKIVAKASKKVVLMVEERKLSEKLNAKVPVEVLPFAYGFVYKKLGKMAKSVELRTGSGKVGPIITDNGNFIIDCDFGVIDNAEELEKELKLISGVIESGIFPAKLIDAVIVGSQHSAKFLD
ncbi:MAG: ribose-5-phosphate isomerase RpiA [Archaeoglobaceae archaeon]